MHFKFIFNYSETYKKAAEKAQKLASESDIDTTDGEKGRPARGTRAKLPDSTPIVEPSTPFVLGKLKAYTNYSFTSLKRTRTAFKPNEILLFQD